MGNGFSKRRHRERDVRKSNLRGQYALGPKPHGASMLEKGLRAEALGVASTFGSEVEGGGNPECPQGMQARRRPSPVVGKAPGGQCR